MMLGASVTAFGQPTETRQHRIIPIRAMSEDVEVLSGDPEAVGQPFVMRIRELVGGVAKRGSGRIRQGFDSGELVAYEVERADGSLFMAEESELRRPK